MSNFTEADLIKCCCCYREGAVSALMILANMLDCDGDGMYAENLPGIRMVKWLIRKAVDELVQNRPDHVNGSCQHGKP